MSSRTHTRRSKATALAVCIAAICALSACNKGAPQQDAASQTATAGNAPAATAPAQQDAVSAQVAAMGTDQLRQAAGTALREQRLYAPAGNNAMEYYVALRDKEPNNAAVASALSDLMPYALIATEQSIGRNDFAEAQRLYALMDKADPHAPALPRLKKSIADGQAALAQQTVDNAAKAQEDAKRQQELQQQRLADQQKAQQQAAQQLAAQQAQEKAAADKEAADKEAAERTAAAKPAAASAATPAPPPAATPAKPAAQIAASSEIRPISTPAPQYPRDALRDGQAGEVQVEFTINPDGSVGGVRVVRSTPPRVFDRAALIAVKRWRFQPVASAVTTRRTIGFSPGG